MLLSKVDSKLGTVFGKYKGYKTVTMPPTWKEREPVLFTFVMFEEELTRSELHTFFNICTELLVPNPRPVSRQLLELSSIFHPLFFESFTNAAKDNQTSDDSVTFFSQIKKCDLTAKMESAIEGASALFYLQSLLFLAGCTLSAAVIQNRFSPGTIESKLNRLWQASHYAKRFDLEDFNALNVDEFVVECDKASTSDTISSIIAIKEMYGEALKSLLADMIFERVPVKQGALSQDEEIRFGFVEDFRSTLGTNLQCILVYGSSVTSQSFADYDAVFVVNDAARALRRLAGSNPIYRGKEINISIYGLEDFISFQAMSGDNLNHNARCIFGETEIPVKPHNDLMVRNFSFAFIRLRQLLGMAGFLAKQKTHAGLQNQTNLYEYFVKIPMHIMKGVRSIAYEPIAKEYINAWTAAQLGYDLNEQMQLIKEGRLMEAIANAYLATREVIEHLNERYQIFNCSV